MERKGPISSQKHANIDLTRLNSTFIQWNWGLQGYTLIFLFLLKNIDCGYSLEPPHWGGSDKYPQSMFWAEIWKLLEFFIWKFSFFGGKILSIFEMACFHNVETLCMCGMNLNLCILPMLEDTIFCLMQPNFIFWSTTSIYSCLI